MTVPVHYLDRDPPGLATMLGGIIEGNLKERPERTRLLSPPAVYGIRVRDAGVEVSLRLGPDRVLVRSGIVRRRDVLIDTDSDTLLALSSVPLRFGFPDLRTESGRDVVRKLIRRELRIRGAILHAAKLVRLNKLLSVG